MAVQSGADMGARIDKQNNRGFTLAELLAAVAIIAVLVAIAIPVFGSQLEKSRQAVDLANTRSAYAELQISKIEGVNPDGSTGPGAIIYVYTGSGFVAKTAENSLSDAAVKLVSDADYALLDGFASPIKGTTLPTLKGHALVAMMPSEGASHELVLMPASWLSSSQP